VTVTPTSAWSRRRETVAGAPRLKPRVRRHGQRALPSYVELGGKPGAAVPDFSFTDLSGAHRRLSQFRGKYVLLDFWGTWCGPCVAEIPHLKTAYESFRARGLEIIGIDCEQPDATPEQRAKGLERARKFVTDNGVTWPQATTESVRDLCQARFRVTAWPTILLLDPRLRIVSAGGKEMPLRSEEPLKTLEKWRHPHGDLHTGLIACSTVSGAWRRLGERRDA